MSIDIQITAEEKRKIEAELAHLRSVEMPALAERIRQARDLGDLSENFDYQDSKRQQGFVSGRIKDLEATLERATVVEGAKPGSGVVGLGSQVKVLDVDFDEELDFILVGNSGAESSADKISASSVVGKALLGSKVGDQVTVATPGGKTTFQILAIS